MPACGKCNTILTSENWYPSKVRKGELICKYCVTKYGSNWNKNHRQQILTGQRDRRKNNRKQYNSYFRDYNQKQKLIVIEHYTNGTMECSCGCSNIACLTIEHLNKDGEKRRKEIGTGLNFYRWVIRNNFPSDLTVLCMNCNWIKRQDRRTKEAIDCIRHYSNGSMSCAMCGTKDLRVLSIDHINNDGYKQMKELNISNLPRWLKYKGFPLGYQVLCMNCQFVKRTKKQEI